MITEYPNALEVEDVEKLRGLNNDILNGADIPKERKDSRMRLLHNGSRRDDLKNYQPIAIISVIIFKPWNYADGDGKDKLMDGGMKCKAVSEEGCV